MSIKKIAIRTDGSVSIGLGHVMRCMAIAQEFQRNKIEVVFFVKKNKITEDLLAERNFKVCIVEDNGSEEKNITELLSSNSISLLILDTFDATEKYVRKLKEITLEKCFIVILDNLRLGKLSADLLINGSIYARSCYKKYLHDSSYLLGLKYTILQSEYQKREVKNIKEKVDNILITMGGSDPKQLTPKVLSLLLNIKDIELVVLVGKGFQNVDKLMGISVEETRVKLVFDSTSIKSYLESSDLAITAGGTTTYEAASLGIPSVLFMQAKNQELPARIFHENGLMTNFGYYKEENKGIYLKSLEELFNNQKKRQQMSDKLQTLVDGNGTLRIMNTIKLFYENWSDKV